MFAGHTKTRFKQDIWLSLIGLLLVLVWDGFNTLFDLDLWVSSQFADTSGFWLRDSFWMSLLLHRDGKYLSEILVVFLLINVVYPLHPTQTQHNRVWRFYLALATILVSFSISIIKYMSLSSCPWDLKLFGGVAQYVSHWSWGVRDGGAGRCFPSGHASAAFAFFTVYFCLRTEHPNFARRSLYVVFCFGFLFGMAQVLRGAHYVSHVLWSAWFCWVFSALFFWLASLRTVLILRQGVHKLANKISRLWKCN
jgi:membrane-associated PAP2 superfamily phosphatase